MAADTGAANVSNSSALLKVEFQNGLAWRGLKQARFYQMVKKNTKFSARYKERTIQISPGRGTGSDFASALAKRGPGKTATFNLYKKDDYVIGSLSCEILETNDKDRIADALLQQISLKGYELGQTISRKFWSGDGGCLARAKASGAVSTTKLYLTSASDCRGFYPGQVCVLASDNGTGTNPTGQREGSFEVSAVYPEASTPYIEATANIVAGVPAAANSDYVFQDGDYGKSWSGIPAWAPTSDPASSGDSFLGVDRYATGDLKRASGFRYADSSGGDMTSNVNKALAKASFYGVEPDDLFCNPEDIAEWMDTLEGRNESRNISTTIAGVSFSAITVHTAGGDVSVISEAKCPKGYYWGTEMANWEYLSQGEVPHFTTTGGEKLHLESTADARQFRMVARSCLDCIDPGKNVIGTW